MGALSLPRRLAPGSRVAVVAPGGPIERERLERGADLLRALGLTLVYDDTLFAKLRYLAGDDAHRLRQLQSALDDERIDAVWAARGGYGVTRLLPSLRLRSLRERPKLLCGFSDLTGLHAAFGALGLGSVHGPNVGQIGELTEPALAQLKATVLSSLPPPPLTGATALSPGTARGVLLGGNLTLLASLCGTPHLPSLAGAILLLEDVGERPYRLDRVLTQLRSTGALAGVRGLALGAFVACEERGTTDGVVPVFEELARELKVPAAIGFPIGHQDDNRAVPLGAEVELDAAAGTLSFLSGLTA
jgi:muramoyltetrapeptide carboxypeptidase